MPNAQGKFLGQGWSRKKAESWERVFAPTLSTPANAGRQIAVQGVLRTPVHESKALVVPIKRHPSQ